MCWSCVFTAVRVKYRLTGFDHKQYSRYVVNKGCSIGGFAGVPGVVETTETLGKRLHRTAGRDLFRPNN